MAGNALLGAVATAGGAVGAAVGALFAAEGAMGKMLSGGGATQGFEIDRGSVLASGQVIKGEIDKLQGKLTEVSGVLQLNAEDDVNSAIAKAWNSRLVEGDESYAGRVRLYIASLHDLVEQLRTAAEKYGFTDQEVVAALGPKS